MRASVVVAGVLLMAHHAGADCLMARGAVFPARGVLPPHPTVYRFGVVAGHPPSIRVEGRDGPVAFTTRDVSATDSIVVTAITVDAGSGPIEILGEAGEPAHRYVVSTLAAPTAPPVPLAVDRVAMVDDRWSASYSEGIAIELPAPGAAAFVARWSNGHEAIVSPNGYAYWASSDWPAVYEPAYASVFLGHLSCAGDQIPTRYIGRLDFTLSAIYPDGTEQEVALPREAVSPTQPPPAPPLLRVAPAAPRWPWLAGLSVASVAFVNALVRRRRRALVV